MKGINYRSDEIELNGKPIVPRNGTGMVGTLRYFDFDISTLRDDKNANVLSVRLQRPHDWPMEPNSTELAMPFLDWNPEPPDGNLGIWRDIELTMFPSVPVSIRFPLVNLLKLPSPENDTCLVECAFELYNSDPAASHKGRVKVELTFFRPIVQEKQREIGHKIYKEVVQIGFENPTGYIVGQKIRITGRSNRRAGSPEAAEYLNREKGHEVLYVSDPEDDISIGGNGGFIWIKALRGLPSDSFESGNDNEHTADGATSTLCPDCPENTLEEADLVQPETKPEPGQESEEGGEKDTVLTEEVLPVQEPERNTVDNSWSPGEIN
eukprot:Stramenopile-MAST_4_protein_4899